LVASGTVTEPTIAIIATISTNRKSITLKDRLVHSTTRSERKGKYLNQRGRSLELVVRAESRRLWVLVAPSRVAIERERLGRGGWRRGRSRRRDGLEGIGTVGEGGLDGGSMRVSCILV
jgi:hypothetical protein